ncbi:MAG: SulP family inorganic anion transporter [Flavobacteriales bacterium]
MIQHALRNFTFSPKDDILSGLTVAIALVPEAVAFAFVAGLSPMVGLYGAFMMGIVTALFGGRPGMISGATGATAVVMIALIKGGELIGAAQGIENGGLLFLLVTLFMVGIIQISAGLFKLGKFVRLIPHPVMMGFVNGLAIVIFLAQAGMFRTPVLENGAKIALPKEEGNGFITEWLQGPEMWTMLGLVALTMSIMYFLPKLTKKIPSALVAIAAVTSIVIFGQIDTATVSSFITDGLPDGQQGGVSGGFPAFRFDVLNPALYTSSNLLFMLPFAFILAAVGLIESLMTLNLVDELTETRGSGNRECVAQGSANILNGFFGGMGGCAMIGQSIINVNSGGRGRLSGISAALALLVFILVGAPVIDKIPIAALVGVMFMVVIGTFAWSSFRILHKIPRPDAFVLIAVSAITVWQDLAIAVIAGVIMSALVFAWKNATMIRARKSTKEDGTKVYQIWGPLFFGSVQNFNAKFDPAGDPDSVEIDFIESKVSDHSGMEAIKTIAEKYKVLGKKVKLTHLSPDCKTLLLKGNENFGQMIEESVEDPRYYVVTSTLDNEV